MSVPLLIYDGDCPICQRAVRWIQERVPQGRLDYLPCQSPERARLAPQVNEPACMQAIHYVAPGGKTYVGEQALPQILALTRNYAWLRGLFTLPGAGLVAHAIYRLIANNRMKLSAFFLRKETGAACSIDKGCN